MPNGPETILPNAGCFEPYKVTECDCKQQGSETLAEAHARARNACIQKIGLDVAKKTGLQNITGLGEGAIAGCVAGGGRILLLKSGAIAGATPVGWVLIASGVVIAGKGVYDVYQSKKIDDAGKTAIDVFCNCSNIIK